MKRHLKAKMNVTLLSSGFIHPKYNALNFSYANNKGLVGGGDCILL